MTTKPMPLSWVQYLQTKLCEECGELIQCVGKGSAFGMDDVNPNTGNANWEDTRTEANDVFTLTWMLGRETHRDLLGHWDQGALINDAMLLKEARVVFYAQWALHKGTLVLDEAQATYFRQILHHYDHYLSQFKLPGPINISH